MGTAKAIVLVSEKVVAPQRPGRPLTTMHSPAVDIVTVAHLLRSEASALEVTWRDAETGALAHSAVLVLAEGGIEVIEPGPRRTRVPVVALARPRKIVLELGCSACSAISNILYLLSIGPDGEPVHLGPRCRRCAGLAYGSDRLLIGAYSRRMCLAWLDGGGLRDLAAQARAAESGP